MRMRAVVIASFFAASIIALFSCSTPVMERESLSGSLVFGDRGNISVLDLDTKRLQQLSDGPWFDAFPSWSPDGKFIVFESDRDGDLEIYVMNADGSSPRQLTDNSMTDGYATFSPDGENIAFQSDRYGAPQIFVVRSSGSEEISMTEEGVRGETFSWK